MKELIITNYIQGLASYLDEIGYVWEHIDDQTIKIHIQEDEDIFRLGFNFGKYYESINR